MGSGSSLLFKRKQIPLYVEESLVDGRKIVKYHVNLIYEMSTSLIGTFHQDDSSCWIGNFSRINSIMISKTILFTTISGIIE